MVLMVVTFPAVAFFREDRRAFACSSRAKVAMAIPVSVPFGVVDSGLANLVGEKLNDDTVLLKPRLRRDLLDDERFGR